MANDLDMPFLNKNLSQNWRNAIFFECKAIGTNAQIGSSSGHHHKPIFRANFLIWPDIGFGELSSVKMSKIEEL